MKLKATYSLEEKLSQLTQHIKKQRHHFADKGPYSQGYGFLVVMSGYESWTIEKAEHRRMYAFYLWCWWRLLVSKEVNGQSILKEINPEYPLEGLMLKLKLQYFGYLMWTVDSLEKTLMLGKIEGRRRGRQRMRWLDAIIDSLDMNLGKLGRGTGKPGVLQSMGSQTVGHNLATEQLWLGRPPGLPAKQFKRYQPAHGSGRLVSRGAACFWKWNSVPAPQDTTLCGLAEG